MSFHNEREGAAQEREELSKRLKHYRRLAGFTQKEAAERLCTSSQTVSNWERGATFPDCYSLILLSKLYGVCIGVLTTGKCVFDTGGSAGASPLSAAKSSQKKTQKDGPTKQTPE